jgi:hypothetical protein
MDREKNIAEFYDLALVNDSVHRDGLERLSATEVRVADAAVFQHRGIFLGRQHPGAGDFLDLGQGRRVIVMGLHLQQDLDVFQPEAKRLDVIADQRGGILEAGVDQNLPGVGGDQEHAQIESADRVERPDDPVAREGCGPAFRLCFHGDCAQRHESTQCQAGDASHR